MCVRAFGSGDAALYDVRASVSMGNPEKNGRTVLRLPPRMIL